MASNNETTTKINVDMSDLKKAAQEAKRQISVINSEFKVVASSMDDWSRSTDGLQGKLNQLNAKSDEQKKILRSLEDQYELTVAEQGKGSAAADRLKIAINNQKAAINQTEKEIEGYNDELDKVAKAQLESIKTGKSLDDILDEMEKSGKDAGEGFTVFKGVLADLVADGIKAVSEALKDLITDSVDAYAQFSASTGTAVDAMGEYEDAIKSIYKNNFGESLTDVAEKMARVKEVTGELDASKLQDMTEKAMTLEDVFGMDMTETLRGVQSLMTHFGMTSEEAFDYLASGAQNGLNYTDELGDNISEYAGKFAEAGYSAEEYFQLLQNGADGGSYNLDKVNDAINEVTTRLADGTIGDAIGSFSGETKGLFEAWQNGEATQKQVIDSIVTDIQNTTSEQEKMNLAASAFGTMAEDGGTKFIESLTAVGNAYDNVQGKADELANTKYDTPAAAIQGIGRTLQVDLLQPMVDSLMPFLNTLAEWVEANLPNFITFVQGIGDKIKAVIGFLQQISPLLIGIGTALVGLALAGLIQNLGAIGMAIKTVITSTKLWTAAQWLLNAALNANPIAIVITIIAALVAAFVALWNKSEAFREFWIGLWDKVKSVVKTVVDAIKGFFSGLWNGIKNIFSGVTGFFGKIFGGAWNAIKSAWSGVTNFFSGIWKGIKNAFGSVADWFKNIFSKAWQGVKDVFSTGGKIFDGIKDGIANVFKSVVNGIIGGINKVVAFPFNAINKAIKKLKKLSILGLEPFSWLSELPVPQIPQLARGGILKKGQVGLLEGDGTEAVVPLEKNTEWIGNVARELASNLRGGTITGPSANGGMGGTVNNFYQTNNSPKALSRLEIYRQSKNLLGYAGGV